MIFHGILNFFKRTENVRHTKRFCVFIVTANFWFFVLNCVFVFETFSGNDFDPKSTDNIRPVSNGFRCVFVEPSNNGRTQRTGLVQKNTNGQNTRVRGEGGNKNILEKYCRRVLGRIEGPGAITAASVNNNGIIVGGRGRAYPQNDRTSTLKRNRKCNPSGPFCVFIRRRVSNSVADSGVLRNVTRARSSWTRNA